MVGGGWGGKVCASMEDVPCVAQDVGAKYSDVSAPYECGGLWKAGVKGTTVRVLMLVLRQVKRQTTRQLNGPQGGS